MRYILLAILLWPVGAYSSEPVLELHFPLLDAPYNIDSAPAGPSMIQSLQLTKDFYQYGHYRLQKSFTDRLAQRLSILGFDMIASWLPLGDSWLHEEWHRAVLGRREIDSYNDVYKLNLFADTIAVSHVLDQDLIELKTRYPREMVRLHAAGTEAQNELNFSLEQDLFFLQSQSFDQAVLWLNYINNWGYLDTCSSKLADTFTADFIREEGARVTVRDFTGLDCNAWVYDLFRPEEAYTARGPHPSGVGIDRYITYSELTQEEKHYLRLQAHLSLINLVNPFLFGRNEWISTHPLNGKPMRWNITLRHHLTSFGYNLGANFFMQQDKLQWMGILHQHRNKSNIFPGLELRLLRFPLLSAPLLSAKKPLILNARAALWLQPQDQLFRSTHGEAGGLFGVSAAYPLGGDWFGFAEIETKTAGWVAGNVYLDDNTSVRMGFSLHLPYSAATP